MYTCHSISLMFCFSQLIGKLEEKCNLLPLNHKKALSADSDEIMYTTPGDVGIYYDDDGQNDVKSPAQNILNILVMLVCPFSSTKIQLFLV